MELATSPVIAENEYKPGGTASLLRDDIVSRRVDQGSDWLGRWAYHTLQGKGDKKITFITAYQPCTGKPNTGGGMTVITQQYSQLLKAHKAQPENVRFHFVQDLKRFIKTRKDAGEQCVLQGDFNEVIGVSHDGMASLCRELQMVDVIHYYHGLPLDRFATYIDGNDILDYVLMDEALLPAVTACGYLPFLEHIHGDHRGSFVDFDTNHLFGAENTQLAPLTRRRLRSNIPQHIETYFKAKHEYLEKQNFFGKLSQLKKGHSKALAEKLDKQLIQASLHAEKQVPQYPDVPFSPAIAKKRNIFNLYRMLLYQHKHMIDLDEQVKANILATHDHFHFPVSLEEIKLYYNKSLSELKAAEKAELKTPAMRQAYLQQKATIYAMDGDQTAAQCLKRLQQNEDTSRVFEKCKQARGKGGSNGFTSIQVPADPTVHPKQATVWRTVDCPKEIERLLLERNRKHFGQAQGTPFTVPPLSQEINFEANTEITDLILNGSYTHEDLDKATEMLIEQLKRATEPMGCSKVTAEEFKGKIKSWKEKTTTSPSGFHLGHLKAYYAPHPIDPKTHPEDFAAFERMRDEILSAHLCLLNFAIERGYSYSRWQKIVTMMIPKEAGNNKIHRLRVIHLYEADYNLLLCIKWRQALQHASKHGLLNESQKGGTPGNTAPDVVYCEEMQYEISRATRTSLCKFDNDATACYDRIHCFLANIASQANGVDRKVCVVQGRTLAQAKYYLKTQLGVSEGFIQHCEAYPIYGTGQGSGNSPAYWVFISSALFNAYAKHAHGARFCTPDGSITVDIHMMGFVDDASNASNFFEAKTQPTSDELLRLMSYDAQLWHDLLWSSGGELELSKCTFHHIRYKFSNVGRPSMIQGQFSPNLFVKKRDGSTTNIKQLGVYQSHKILGNHKTPVGCQLTQASALRQKCLELAKAVNCSILNRWDSKVFYDSIYIPSVTYPLSTTYFTASQLTAIHRPATKALARHIGYWKGTPWAVLHGPPTYGGQCLTDIVDSQGIGQIQMVLKHWRTPSEASKLTKVAISWWQFVAGTSTPILEDLSAQLPQIDNQSESKYIQSVRQYLLSINATIQLDTNHVPPPQRENDAYIMDMVLAAPSFRRKNGSLDVTKVYYANLFRLYLQVTTVSDLAMACGEFIDPVMWKRGETSTRSSRTKHLLCHQARPQSPAVLTAWRAACALLCDDTGRLLQPLGQWLVPAAQLRREWPAYYDPDTHTMFRPRQPNGFTAHEPLSASMLFPLDPTFLRLTLPATALPMDAVMEDTTWRSTKPWQPIAPPKPTPATPEIFYDVVKRLPDWEKHLFEGLAISTSEPELAMLIRSGDFILASDGSAPNQASFAWVLSTLQGERVVMCSGPVFGHNPSPFRAEAYGILSALRFIIQFLHYSQHIPLKPYLHLSDCKGLLNRISQVIKYEDYYANSTLVSDWDVVNEIIISIRSMEQPPNINHIKSHQDKHKPYKDLPLKAQLNCDADRLADNFLDTCRSNRTKRDFTIVPIFPHAGAQLHLPEGTVTSKLKKPLTEAKHGPALLAHIVHRNKGWDEATPSQIDWKSHGIVVRYAPHQVTLIKMIHDLLPVGKRTAKYDPKYSPYCSNCSIPTVEDTLHLCRCPSPNRAKSRTKLMTAIRKQAEKLNTRPPLLHILMEGIMGFFQGRDTLDLANIPPKYQLLVQQQNTIGWYNFLKGLWSLEWTRLQLQHHTPSSNGSSWTIQLMRTIWDSFYELWEERNTDLHGKEFAERRAAQRIVFQREITQLYAQKDSYTDRMHPLFQTPLKTLLAKRHYQLYNWLATWRSVLQEDGETLEDSPV